MEKYSDTSNTNQIDFTHLSENSNVQLITDDATMTSSELSSSSHLITKQDINRADDYLPFSPSSIDDIDSIKNRLTYLEKRQEELNTGNIMLDASISAIDQTLQDRMEDMKTVIEQSINTRFEMLSNKIDDMEKVQELIESTSNKVSQDIDILNLQYSSINKMKLQIIEEGKRFQDNINRFKNTPIGKSLDYLNSQSTITRVSKRHQFDWKGSHIIRHIEFSRGYSMVVEFANGDIYTIPMGDVRKYGNKILKEYLKKHPEIIKIHKKK